MSKNSNGLRAGLRALTNPMNLPDFAPGEYDEGWEPGMRVLGQSTLSDDVKYGGIFFDPERPENTPGLTEQNGVLYFDLPPLELDERRFNWRNFRFYALAFTGLVLSQTLIALAVDASR